LLPFSVFERYQKPNQATLDKALRALQPNMCNISKNETSNFPDSNFDSESSSSYPDGTAQEPFRAPSISSHHQQTRYDTYFPPTSREEHLRPPKEEHRLCTYEDDRKPAPTYAADRHRTMHSSNFENSEPAPRYANCEPAPRFPVPPPRRYDDRHHRDEFLEPVPRLDARPYPARMYEEEPPEYDPRARHPPPRYEELQAPVPPYQPRRQPMTTTTRYYQEHSSAHSEDYRRHSDPPHPDSYSSAPPRTYPSEYRRRSNYY
jgi:hypothetical protein